MWHIFNIYPDCVFSPSVLIRLRSAHERAGGERTRGGEDVSYYHLSNHKKKEILCSEQTASN